jgi:hypothetical protein
MEQAVLTTLAAVAGFLAKSGWDLYWKRREQAETLARSKRIELLERQLSQFYWPLYLHLQKNNVIWDHLIHGSAIDPALKAQVDRDLYNSFVLPNHEAMVKIIEAGAHLARPDDDFGKLLLRFIRHVTIFKTMREAELPYDPIAVGEPWPSEFFGALESRLRATQASYDREVGLAT